jgi:hypothetical protein
MKKSQGRNPRTTKHYEMKTSVRNLTKVFSILIELFGKPFHPLHC